jgi:hypothetical protein
LAQFSDEMGDDAPFLVNHLTQELAAAVAQAENARILNTFGDDERGPDRHWHVRPGGGFHR